MTNYYTENFAEFGFSEIKTLQEILSAWIKSGLPNGFDNDGVKPALNKNSGYVFLTNNEYQVAMLNESRLEIYHNLPYSGIEGFLEDIISEYTQEELHQEDLEYIRNAAEIDGITQPTSKI
ncbi:hypothetical protein [Mucilaginibacter sp.]|uniref:hypothetical protein n=1 Tax=Mucilaginibacter sp. TaxID=1882438 RepID=UPI0035BC7C6F